MDLVEGILLLAVMALALALRAIPSIKNGHYGYDSYYHLLVARTISERKRLPEKDTYMAPEGDYGYPPLLHVLLKPFAWKHEIFALRYLAPAIDTLTVLVAYGLACQLGVHHPILIALIVAVSPMAVLQGASLSPRPLGNLALSFAMFIAFVFWKTPDLRLIPFLVVSETLVMLSHKMSTQTLLVAHPAVSLAIMYYNPAEGLTVLLALPAALALAVLVTRGRYLTRVLKDHIGFIRVHTRHGDYVTGKKGLPSPIRSLKSDPLSFAGPFLAAWLFYDVGMFHGFVFLFAWSVAVLAIASFWPWGDAWRHMAFGTVPSAVILAFVVRWLKLDDVLYVGILLLVAAALAAVTFIQLRRTIRGDQAARLISAMQALPGDWKTKLRDALVYSNVIHYALPYELGVRCLGTNPNAKGIEVSFKVREAGHSSLTRMAQLTKELTGSEPEYFMLFEGGPSPDETGHKAVYDGPGLRILVKAA